MAVTVNATELATAVDGGLDPATAIRLLAVSRELVERYCPEAPDQVANEAVIRCSGWLADQPSAPIRSQSVGPMSLDFEPSRQSALRHSGAMALLSPWKIRRGGAIG